MQGCPLNCLQHLLWGSSWNTNKSLIHSLYLSFSSNSYFFNISQISFYSQPASLCYCFPHLLLLLQDSLYYSSSLHHPFCLSVSSSSQTFPFTYGNSAQFGVSSFFFLIIPHSCSSSPLLPFPWTNLPPDIWLCFSARSYSGRLS